MFRYFRESLSRQIIAQFLLAVFIPVTIISILAFTYVKEELKQDAFNQLSALEEIKKHQILDYFKERLTDVTILATLSLVKNSFQELKTYHTKEKIDPGSVFNVTSQRYISIAKKIDPFLQLYTKSYEYHDLVFICNQFGHVMYSVARENDLGTNLKTGPFKNSGLARLWSKVVATQKTTMTDYSDYAPSNAPAAFLGAPVMDSEGRIIGVIALQVSTRQIDAIMQNNIGMGKTGETYLVGEDLLMRSDSRFEPQSTILKKKIDTPAVRRALKQDEPGQQTEIIKDYRDIRVLSSYSHLGLDKTFGTDFDWMIIAEIDESEAFAPITGVRWRILITGIGLVLLAWATGYMSSKVITRPLNTVSKAMVRIADGDLTVEIHGNGENETGKMMTAMKTMVKNLREMVGVVTDAAIKTNQSVTEISSAVEEQSAVITQQSSSVAEITSTLEEFSASSSQIADHSASVADTTDQTLQKTREGALAVETVRTQMGTIHQDNQNNIHSIMDLGKRSGEITKVMDIINNIADQTKLIAFNAALEASSAGEAGKRFGVVANEIRRLADNVMESTDEIEKKIQEIQAAVNNLVISSENTTKGIETSLDYAVEATQHIEAIVEDVESNANAAKQISISAQQQKTASEQVVTAVKEIAVGAGQTGISMEQIKAIGRELADKSAGLKKQVTKFKL
ncbi:MAG: methyl-accepting chemotaxis protein [Desulfobacteraceae bacterium]|nr:methyl-accepting chemotaxis protein [Desulfobacteraceae bacterium]